MSRPDKLCTYFNKPMAGTTIHVQIPWDFGKSAFAIGKEDKEAG